MKTYTYFVIFSIDQEKFAVPYESVIEATKSVEIIPLPYLTRRIHGIINFHGKIIPVINLRKILRKTEKNISITDSLIVVNSIENALIAIVADAVHELFRPHQKDITKIDEILPSYTFYEGTIKAGDILIPIVNTDKLLGKKDKLKLEEENLTIN